MFNLGSLGALSDGELLKRFHTEPDVAGQEVFRILVERHGRMVLSVCRNSGEILHEEIATCKLLSIAALLLAGVLGTVVLAQQGVGPGGFVRLLKTPGLKPAHARFYPEERLARFLCLDVEALTKEADQLFPRTPARSV